MAGPVGMKGKGQPHSDIFGVFRTASNPVQLTGGKLSGQPHEVKRGIASKAATAILYP